MKIVIDIPKKQYVTLNAKSQDEVLTVVDNGLLIKAIKNGTPLPKGHGRLIDADLFVQKHPLAFVRDVINDAPTIIEADKETDDYYRGAQEEY